MSFTCIACGRLSHRWPACLSSCLCPSSRSVSIDSWMGRHTCSVRERVPNAFTFGSLGFVRVVGVGMAIVGVGDFGGGARRATNQARRPVLALE